MQKSEVYLKGFMKYDIVNVRHIRKYITCIKDISVKIKDLKISISKVIIFHILNNFSLYFQLYLEILNFNIWEKEILLIISIYIETLENKQMCSLNKNKRRVNYAHSSKAKKELAK